MLQPGTHLGRYEIQRRLGRGGMGTVYVAHDPILGRLVAIKVFLGDLDLPDAAARFSREARAAAALNHANIVTIHDYGDFSGQPYIVMEYIQGETLADVIRRKAPVSVSEKLRWIEELCAGASYAHQATVIHRDIKPANLMIDRSGRLKILDFGIARMWGTLSSSAAGLIGTPGYMAPELILGKPIDYRSDLFSIGVVCYELLAYSEAFPGETMPTITHKILSEEPPALAQLIPDVRPEVSEIVGRALKKSAEDRFADAESFRLAVNKARRQLESSSAAWTVEPTIVRTNAVGAGGAGSQSAVSNSARDAVGVGQLTPPPDPRRTDREMLALRRAAQIDASLEQARGFLHRGELEAALEACLQALTLDDTHQSAHELEQTIKTALAKGQAIALLEQARGKLREGALTAAQDLLHEARTLDPDVSEASGLRRDLRLARVEQERLRQRAEALNRALDAAERALSSGEVESALAFARQALELSPNSEKARGLEAEALRRLDEESRGMPAFEPRQTAPSSTVAADRSGLSNVIGTKASVAAPTIVAPPGRRTPMPKSARQRATAPALGMLARRVATTARRVATTTVATVWAFVGSVQAAVNARPRREKLLIGWATVAVVVAAIALAGIALIPQGPTPTGTLIVDAVPWANIMAVERADGTSEPIASASSTPMVLNLPVGTYHIRLVGPPPESESRLVPVQVGANAVTTASVERFRMLTPEEYFEQYLPSLTPTPSEAAEVVPVAAPTPVISGAGP